MNNEYIVKMGQVESIEDQLDGGRIKVRLAEDQNRPLSEIPYAFPINPKMFQCIPQVGECVLIISSQIGNADSQRYYLGPVVSQMQDISKAPYNYGAGTAISLLQGGIVGPSKPISQWSETDGAFPDKDDIAIIGRRGDDIVLRDGEIDLRCGIRKEIESDDDDSLYGNVALNSKNPTYIQMKHKPHLINNGGGDGVVNIVSDKINLVSYNGKTNVKLVNPSSKQNNKTEPLLTEIDLNELIPTLHPLPFGDKLVEVLKLMCDAIACHVHPIGNLPPCGKPLIDEVMDVRSELDSILSKDIKIN